MKLKYLYLVLILWFVFCDLTFSALRHAHTELDGPKLSWNNFQGVFYKRCTPDHQASILAALKARPYTWLFFAQESGNHGAVSLVDPTTHLYYVDQLGRGGFGIVCTTIDVRTGMKYATKLIPTMCDMNGRFYSAALGGIHVATRGIRSAISEILCLVSCNHDAFPRLHSSVLHNSVFFITQQFMEGEHPNKMKILENNLDLVRKVAYQLIDALEYLHNRGIIHRDIKPENLKVKYDRKTSQVNVHVLDFGIAVFSGQTMQEPYLTPRYSPPKSDPSHRLATFAYDVYGAGVTIYEIFTQKMFESGLGELVNVDQEFYRLLSGMTDTDPRTRFTTSECKSHAFFSSLDETFKSQVSARNRGTMDPVEQSDKKAIEELDGSRTIIESQDTDSIEESSKKRKHDESDSDDTALTEPVVSREAHIHKKERHVEPVTNSPCNSPPRGQVHHMKFPNGLITPKRPINPSPTKNSPFKNLRGRAARANRCVLFPLSELSHDPATDTPDIYSYSVL